ncbi:unnamed protein product [Thelazia callipaeda]|uniref:Wsv453 n=1 Tax=Thelazia callipaeda TaxID=103827 RepID=A0A0N5CUD4_THECL|nr:unnamed protein product [Thelazia callipaeda]
MYSEGIGCRVGRRVGYYTGWSAARVAEVVLRGRVDVRDSSVILIAVIVAVEIVAVVVVSSSSSISSSRSSSSSSNGDSSIGRGSGSGSSGNYEDFVFVPLPFSNIAMSFLNPATTRSTAPTTKLVIASSRRLIIANFSWDFIASHAIICVYRSLLLLLGRKDS